MYLSRNEHTWYWFYAIFTGSIFIISTAGNFPWGTAATYKCETHAAFCGKQKCKLFIYSYFNVEFIKKNTLMLKRHVKFGQGKKVHLIYLPGWWVSKNMIWIPLYINYVVTCILLSLAYNVDVTHESFGVTLTSLGAEAVKIQEYCKPVDEICWVNAPISLSKSERQ